MMLSNVYWWQETRSCGEAKQWRKFIDKMNLMHILTVLQSGRYLVVPGNPKISEQLIFGKNLYS